MNLPSIKQVVKSAKKVNIGGKNNSLEIKFQP